MRTFLKLMHLGFMLSVILCLAQEKAFGAKCPCDIYASGGTPCVAAHSTVRALYATYNGPLYQVRRTADNQTKDIGVLTTGGFANSAAQDSFLSGKAGTISIIYDQSPKGNHLPKSPPAQWLGNGGKEANATGEKIMVNGHVVYGIYVVANAGIAYRINSTKGIATGDQPEAMYMVLDGKRYTDKCCFDYGNAETNGRNNGNATMEAIYWGSNTSYARGGGSGPWIAGDFENGMYEGNSGNTPSNTSITGMSYVTAILKGPSGNHFTLKAGNAQSGKLEVKWDGARPPTYSPMKKEGSIILGTGGDGSSSNDGTFFEGCMTSGVPPDSTDDSVQANIVAAGYGSSVTTTRYSDNNEVSAFLFKVRYNSSNANAVISYTLQDAGHVSMNIFDQRGRLIATIASGIVPAGRHAAVWNAKQVPAGVYVCGLVIDGMEEWARKIVVGK